ncbi:anaphase-promoting complex subunit 2 [Anthonomus grandis grandis]|uniref:anaphase-promoting complex subunit 2 n=1 Tax=Anthonomus grandis grandis TaxID=2921223 RepID=UPI00216687CC|nr:anaphase-promoting complex subunit 2 [Anthonomus grandis grandis]
MNENPDFKGAWTLCQRIFPILNDAVLQEQEPIEKKEFDELCNFANTQGLQDLIQHLIFGKIEKRLRDEVLPEFWAYFKKAPADDKGLKPFYNAVKSLYDNFRQLDNVVSTLGHFRQATDITEVPYNENNVHESLKLILHSTMLAQLHVDYQSITISFYEAGLQMQDSNIMDEHCVVCGSEKFSCNCLHLFQETNRKLGEMSLLEPLVGQTLTNVSYNYIHNHIQKICKDNYDSFIVNLEKWLHTVVIQWLKKIYYFDTSIPLEESMERLEKKLVNYLYNCYIKVRIEQLFNIVIEYPESLPSLEDICLGLPRTDLKPLLTKKLQKAMETRLLHPGVSTTDILTAYIATIRSLRILDPTGLLLETVTYPIHQYLRSREDTVRCVVSSLTEDGPNELAEELNKGEVDENTPMDEGEEENWETWTPDPVDSLPSKKIAKETSGVNRRNADIISMLINIYGSKELFVNEYRTLLADRLLAQYQCDTDKEIRYLDLLKLRFGDSNLQFCEVMLKDITDSRKINEMIKENPEYSENVQLKTLIVSQQFWPPFKDETLELHSTVTDQMKKFNTAFELLKGSRTLCYKNHLGVVDLDIELNDRTMSLSVTPVHATIIMHFQDKSTWELEDLGKVMHCPPTVLRRKIGFWLSHGILTEVKSDVFSIQEEVVHKQNPQEDIYVDEFESESAMASAEAQKEEELQNIWSYIIGMLMNLDSLSLDRIHHMLKMFAFQGPTSECSQSELKAFLDRKVRERLLIYSNGLYKLPK